MDPQVRQLIQALHDAPGRVMLVAAGAGTQALAWLLGVAGASRTLLEALVPYAEASFNDFLGQRPAQYVAPLTAGLLAGRAVTRALQLGEAAEPLIGLACTATIVTDRPKRGQHRAHVATWCAGRVSRYDLVLDKGARDRAGEEGVVSRLMLNALAEAFGLPERLELNLGGRDALRAEMCDLEAATASLLAGRLAAFGIAPEGTLGHERPAAVLSGAFNPLHDGHLALAQVGAELLGRPVTFELAAANADKPDLSQEQTLGRLLQFAGRYSVIASGAATFVEKARLYPGATFVVGYDTAARVLAPRYYGGSLAQMRAALAELAELGCSFLVAGREDDEGVFHEAASLPAPPGPASLFAPIPSHLFRRDISSTELRAGGRRGSR
ncbi:MAG: hypothetical protein ACRDHL_09105 [Candidatus Promineifilaceae bacterium]